MVLLFETGEGLCAVCADNVCINNIQHVFPSRCKVHTLMEFRENACCLAGSVQDASPLRRALLEPALFAWLGFNLKQRFKTFLRCLRLSGELSQPDAWDVARNTHLTAIQVITSSHFLKDISTQNHKIERKKWNPPQFCYLLLNSSFPHAEFR